MSSPTSTPTAMEASTPTSTKPSSNMPSPLQNVAKDSAATSPVDAMRKYGMSGSTAAVKIPSTDSVPLNKRASGGHTTKKRPATQPAVPSKQVKLTPKGAKKPQQPVVWEPNPAWHDYKLPSFSPETFLIYARTPPVPTNFRDNLSQSRLQEKLKLDKADQENDHDDGADDWDTFPSPECFRSQQECYHAVAITTVIRAKRAFWAGKTWLAFAIHEMREVASEAPSRPITEDFDPSMMFALPLEDNLRRAIFEQFEVRLCQEIWVQPHPGTVTWGYFRRDSVRTGFAEEVRAPARAVSVPPHQRERDTPRTAVEARAMTAQRQSRGLAATARIGSIGLAGRIHHMTAVDEIVRAPLDMETSDEDRR